MKNTRTASITLLSTMLVLLATKLYRTILTILLILTLLLPIPGCNDYGMTCTVQCQGIEDDTAWNNCMLQCHKERSK